MQTHFMLSDSQWDEVRTIIEPKPRKRKVLLQVIVSGIIYLLDNGCKWEGLPTTYGNYKLVWYYYNKWMVFTIVNVSSAIPKTVGVVLLQQVDGLWGIGKAAL